MKILIAFIFAVLPFNYSHAKDKDKETDTKRAPAAIATIGGATLQAEHSQWGSILSVLKVDASTTCYYVSMQEGGISEPVCMVNGRLILGQTKIQ